MSASDALRVMALEERVKKLEAALAETIAITADRLTKIEQRQRSDRGAPSR